MARLIHLDHHGRIPADVTTAGILPRDDAGGKLNTKSLENDLQIIIIYHMQSTYYHVYIMTNTKNGTLYIGVTNDIARRVWEHKQHINPQSFTSRYKCHNLVYFEDYKSRNDALNREKQLKDKSRQYKIKLIESINPNWDDLSQSMDFWMS